MRNFNKLFFALSLLFLVIASSYSQNASISINGNQSQTVCLNENTLIRFRVNNGNNDPYTFTYTINGVLPAQSITTATGSNSVFLPVNNSISGSFTFLLIGVLDNNNNSVNIGSNDQVIITVNSTPAPTITGDLSICDGATSQLTVTGGNINHTWSSSSQQVATVTNGGLVSANNPGTTTITYSNNNNGCDNSVLFTVNPLPTISVQGGGNGNSVCAGSTINLNGSGTPATTNPWVSSNTSIAAVDSSGLVTGNAPGNVIITYTDSNGCTITKNIQVNGSSADFSYTTGNLCSGSSVSFNTTSAGSSYTWNFGDGGTSSNQNPTHTFVSYGCGVATFNVTLTVTGTNGCPSTKTKIVTIQQQPDVNFVDLNPDSTEPFSNCGTASIDNQNFDINVGLSTSSSNCQTYSINWGDSQVTTNATFPAFHSYNSLGTYTMSITSVGVNGCSVVKNFTIKNSSNPSGGFGSPGNTTGLCVPTNALNFSITASSYDSLTGDLISPGWDKNSPDTTYFINWGDGTTTGPLLQSSLIQTVYFNNNINGTASNYPIAHSYTTVSCPSVYTATLTVTNSCGATDFTLNNISTISKPIASFTAPPAACANTNVLFTNTSTLGFSANCTRGTRFSWNFGDPASGASNTISYGPLQATTPNANHVFSGPGYYTVTLTANSGGTPGCGNSVFTQNICIESQLNPQFTLSGTEFCSPGIVQVNNTTSFINPCNPTYQWNVTYAAGYCGSGTPTWSYTNGTSSTSANPSFSFETPGTYSISLTTTNSCGSQTSPIQTVIIKQPPTVVIASIPDICLGATVTPTISVNSCSNLALPTSPPAYSWTATGATPSTSNATIPPIFSYSTPGTYTISLSVTNECGTTNASQSFVLNPLPLLTGPTTVCVGQSISISADTAGAVTNPWVSSNTAIATVNASGVVTGVSGGTATITFTNSNNCQASMLITVNALPTITGNLSICIGSTTTLSGSAIAASSTPWVSSNTGVATISAAGIVTSVSVGTTTITYTNSNGCQQTAVVTVNPLPTISGTLNVCVGATTLLTGSASPSLTNPWVSSNTAVATISSTGVVTGVSIGTSIITYTNTNGCQKTVTVTVNPTPVVSNRTAVICSGSSFTVTPSGASPNVIPSGTTYSWVAPVVTGGITGGASGTSQTTITGTLTNPTNLVQTATYTVTPTSGAAGNCVGATFTVVVTVNPQPLIPNQVVSSCSGTAFSVPLVNTPPILVLPANTTFTWTVTPPAGISGTSNQTTGVSSIGQTLTNSTNAAIIVLYNVTASSGVTPNICTSTFTVSVTVNPTPRVSNVTATICSNTAFSVTPTNGGGSSLNDIVPVGTTYSWSTPVSNPVGAITGGSAATDVLSPISQTLINTTSSAATLTYTVTPKSGSCSGTPFTIVVTVNPSPAVTFSPLPQTICSGDTSLVVTLSSTTSGVTYNWTATQPAGITGVSTSGTSTIGAQQLFNSTSSDITVTYDVTASIAGGSTCIGTVYPYTITVKPKPNVANLTSTICSGLSFSVTPSNSSPNSIPTGTTYSWGVPVVTGGITGGLAGSLQTSIAGTLTNPTNTVRTATYTVTPTVNGCSGTTFTVTVTVNPTPVVSNRTAIICSGSSFTVTPSAASPNVIPSGTTYSWGAPVVTGGITGGASGTLQTTITGTLINPTNLVQTATYTVTPTSGAAGNCVGATFTVVVTVNPQPLIPNQVVSSCSGTAFSVPLVNTPPILVLPANTTFTWTVTPPAGISGTSNQTTGVSSIGQTLTNSTNAAITVLYNVTASSGVTPNICTSTFTVSVTFNPTPRVSNVTATICSNTSFSVNPTNGGGSSLNDIVPSGTTYSWPTPVSNPVGAVTGGSAATDVLNPISQTLTNTTSAAATLTYTVTPKSGSCSGTPFTIVVTVNPSPAVTFSPLPQTICSGDTSLVVTLSSTTTGVTYNWTAPQPAGITGVSTSGTSTIGAQQLINSTSSAITITYNATATIAGGSTCVGIVYPYTIIVNPKPVVLNQVTTACSDSALGVTLNASSSVAVTTYNITNIANGGLVASAGNPVIGTGFTSNEIFNDAWTNVTPLPVNVVYTVVPVSNASCLGNPFTVTVTVNPEPVVVNQTVTICSDIANGIVLGNDANTPQAVTYNITNIANGGLVAFAGAPTTGVGFTANEIANDAWTNTTSGSVNVVYTVVPVSAQGCAGNAFTVTVTVESTLGVGPQVVTACSDVANGFALGTSATATYDITSITIPTGLVASAGSPQIGTGFASNVIANDAWTNLTAAPLAVIYTIEPVSSNGCSGQPFTVTVTVNPEPVVSNQVATICSDSASGVSLNLSSSVVASTYNITNLVNGGLVASAGNPVIGTGFTSSEISNDAWTNTTPVAVNVVYTVVPVSANNCQGNPFTVTVTVNPEPVVVNQTGTICSDIANGIVLGNDINTPQAVTCNITNISNGGLVAFAGSPTTGVGFTANEIANDAWTNTTSGSVNVVYTVVPVSAQGCAGNAFTVTVTVESTLGVGPQVVTACSDVANGFALGTSATATYDITSITIPTGLVASAGSPQIGTGFNSSVIANDAWTNLTTTPLAVVYTIEPVSSNGCIGQPFTVTATINPEPVVSNQVTTACSDVALGIPINASSSVSAATYNITSIVNGGLVASAGNPVTGTGFTSSEISNDAWTNTTPVAVNVVYTVVPVSANNCQGNPFTVTLTVNPEPVVVNQTGTICSDIANGIVLGNDLNTPQAVTYNITNIANGGLVAFAGNPIIGVGFTANEIANDAWTNTTSGSVNVVYTVVPVSAQGCAGNAFTVTVTVESTLGVGPQVVTACSDAAIGFLLGAAPNTTYNITSVNQNGLTASAGTPAIGNGLLANVIADDAWTNTTALPVTVVYTVLPVSSNGCIGQPFTVTATINPEPVVSNQVTTACSDVALGIPINASSSVVAATYNITSIANGGLVASAGTPATGTGFTSNEIFNDAWTNTTPVAVNVVYTVVPVSGAGCLGNPFTVTVTVNPEPVVVNQTGTICSDINNGIVLGNDLNTPQAVTYNITNIANGGLVAFAGNPITGVGFTANEIANDAWINTTSGSVNVVYTVVPVSAQGCAGNAFTVTVTVESTLGVGPQVVTTCSDVANGFNLGTAPNTTYNITAINQNGLTPSAGNPVTGLGFLANEIADDAWTNTTPLPVTVVYTVLPVSSNGCIGQPFTVTVTVNPEPVVLNQVTTACSDVALGIPINASSSVVAATYNIMSIVNGGLVASAGTPVTGTGFTTSEISNDAWTNTTPVAVNVVYTVVPVSGAGCLGNPFTITVTVNPEPVVVNQIGTICSDIANGIVLGNDVDTPLATTYNITAINSNGLPIYAGTPTTGVGFTANEIADDAWTNTTPLAVDVVYTVVPVSAQGCEGNPFTVTVTVESTLGILPQVVTTCSDVANGFILAISANTTYTITSVNANGLVAVSGNPVTGAGFLADALADDVWNNSTPLAVNVIYTIEPVSANGCSGQPFTVTVTVNPEPIVLDQVGTICSDVANGIVLGNDIDTPIATTYNITSIVNGGLVASAGTPITGTGFSSNEISNDAWTNTTPVAVNVVYTVVPVSGAGCLGTPFTVTVTVNPEPVVVNQTGTICSDIPNGVVLGNDIDTPQAVTYNITSINSNGLPIFAGSPSTGTGLLANEIADDAWTNTTPSAVDVVYTVVPVSTDGCEGNAFTVTVTVESELVIASQSAVLCSDLPNGIILGVNPTATYDIISIVTNGLTSSSGNPQVVTNVLANEVADDAWTNSTTADLDIIYTVVPRTSAGCYGDSFTITLTINPEPIVVNQIATICSDEQSTITLGNDIDGPTAVSYNIVSISNGGLPSYSGNPIIGSGFSAAEIFDDAWTNTTLATVPVIYTIVPVSAQGCLGNPFTVTMNINPQINVQITTTPITCYGANNATITLTVTGGSPAYTAQWDNLATGFYQNNLAAGTYVILITDNVMCTKTVTVVIPEAPIFTIYPIVKNISCYGAHDGSINLNLIGGLPPLALTWSDGSPAGLIRNNLGPGTYTAMISDGTPCYITRTFTIVEPQPLVVSANISDALDCLNANSGSINLIVSGGTPSYSYNWSNGVITEDLIAITSGNYQVVVTDANGCTNTKQYSIIRPAPIVVNVSTQTTFDCNTHNVSQNFVAAVSGGVPPYSYQWSSGTVLGANNEIMHTDVNGTVLLTVTDHIGCQSTYSVTVDIPVIGFNSFDTTSYGYTSYGIYSIGDPIQFQSTVTGDYESIIWDFGDGTFSSELNPIHTYSIPKDYIVKQIVTYPFGCVYIQTISLIIENGYLLVVPTAFTPNQDTLNDKYRPVTKRMKNITLDIYDSWGSLIYSEKGDVIIGWDGKIKGYDAENGNYNSKVSAETFYGTIINQNQTFVLIK